MQPILALQIDPLDTLNLQTDTSLMLALEAQHRGYRVFSYQPQQLAFDSGKITARGLWIHVMEDGDNIYTQVDSEGELNLNKASIVLMRQDPPFNERYLANTYLLEQLDPHVRVLNSPKGIRNACEKTLPLLFPDLIPPTLITEDVVKIEEFAQKHEKIVLKPLFGHGGNDVFALERSKYKEIPSLFSFFKDKSPAPIIVQSFLEEIVQGDKRIIMIDGDVIGGFRRVPQKGDIRSNLAQGGRAEPCELSARDIEICKKIGSTLHEMGLYLAGIDVIGDYLIEVNVTSPTGLRILKRLYSIDAAKMFFDKLEM